MDESQMIALIQQSLFLSEKVRAGLLVHLGELNEDQREALFLVLQEAEEKQNGFLTDVLKLHPNFLADLQQFTAEQINTARQEAEEAERQKEVQKLGTLDLEIANIQ